ncbi:MAG: TolC family protein [Thermoguttaceae bacterium]
MRLTQRLAPVAGVVLLLAGLGRIEAQETRRFIFPEQRHLEVRDPSQFPRTRLPNVPPPSTVVTPRPTDAVWTLSLDEAVRIALANADVIRVVAGNTVVASGPTIYEPAIQNTQIDQSRATFDPRLESRNTFSQVDQPFGVVTPGTPPQYGIQGNPIDGFSSSTGVSKSFATGGSMGVNVNADQSRRHLGAELPLNPQVGNDVTLYLNQPLLKGAGSEANLAPILVARLNTERSFFQLKDSVQDLVLSVIQTYWNLSYAQLDVWARRQQVEQGREAVDRAEGRLLTGLGNEGDVAQARVSYENFRAMLVSSEANLLNQEAVLRNVLGLSLSDQRRIELSTAPITNCLETPWDSILRLAEEYRPDLIELKLILEADQQQMAMARNQALPQADVGLLYRWNGLEGTTPDGQRLSTRGGEYADWEAGVTFSVPLGLRKERAVIRERELLIMRDRANLQQALHGTSHELGASFRNVAQYYQQYAAYRRMREAARLNLEQQMADFMAHRRTLYLTVLQALTDWGNAVTSEYQALIQYNTELARLERQTGTILETHGVRFVEERYHAVGPLGRFFADPCYPRDVRPGPNTDRPPAPGSETYQRPEKIELPDIDAENVRLGPRR